MKTIDLRSMCVIVAFLSLWVNTSSTAWAFKSQANEPANQTDGRQMTQEELQAAVISYANRYIAVIGQAAVQLEEAIRTDEARLNAARRKVYSMVAVVETAAGPNPGPALLDLVVNATLSRMVWEDYWVPQVFGKPGTIMVEAFKKMEGDAWDLAAKVMTIEQRQEFRDLIDDWYADHPGQISVDYVTFSDFGDIGKKPNLKNIQKPGGLLAPIREATEAVDDVRMTIDRAMFLLAKMQLAAGSQVELVYKKLAMQPEIKTILADISGLQKTADRCASLLEEMPRHVAAERQAIFDALEDKAPAIHQINTDLQATLRQADLTLKELQRTTQSAHKLIASTEKWLDWFESDDSTEPVTVDDYLKAIDQVRKTISDLDRLLLAVDQTGTPLISMVLDRFNQAAAERVDHIFWRLLTLIAAAGGIGLVMLTVHWRLKKK